MIVKVLGCDGGVAPGFKATSFLIDGQLLIDVGSVADSISIAEQSMIDYILISHAHLDHTGQLAFICDNCFGMRDRPFATYAHRPVLKAVKEHLFNDVIWPDFSKIPSKEDPTLEFHSFEAEEKLELGDYEIIPVPVNHDGGAVGYIVIKEAKALVFTLDTGATERIWEVAKDYNVVGIFTEVSFPNRMKKVAELSYHFTPEMFKKEVSKMPQDVPLFVSHLKPNFNAELCQEIRDLGLPDVTILRSDCSIFSF